MKYILLLGSVIFVIVRTGLYIITRFSQNNLINRIKKQHSTANDYILNLNIVYNKRENSDQHSFDLIKKKLELSPAIGSYTILHTLSINEHQFLVFTKLLYSDFDVTITGRHSDVRKKSYHDFLLNYNKDKAELTVYSSLYFNATDKFQKEEFFKSLLGSN